MIRISIIVLVLLCQMHDTFGQKNLSSGYVIQTNGDTLSGFIDYRNWGKNPKQVTFKASKSANAIGYTPLDIVEFGVADECYKGAIVQTEISPFRTNELTNDKEPNFRTDTVFLQTMIQGPKSLFHYKTQAGKDQFYIEENDNYTFLLQKKYVKEVRGKRTMAENKAYLSELLNYLDDCPTINAKIKELKYTKKELEKLFVAYYDCIDTPIPFHKKTPRITIDFGVLAGVSASSTNFKSQSAFNDLVNTDFPTSVDPIGGIFIDLIFPRNQKRWSVSNEIMISSFNTEVRTEDVISESTTIVNNTNIAMTYLKVNHLVRYKRQTENIAPYINAGISNGFALSHVNEKSFGSIFNGNASITEGKALNEIRTHEQGILVGIGTFFKQFTIEIRAEIANGISPYATLDSDANRFQLLAGYRFN